MKKLLVASIVAAAFCAAPAIAADLPTKGPVYREAAFNWTGFYAGASAGYGWSKIDTFESTAAVSTSNKLNGYFLGGQLGYNWQLNPNWVFGLEGDWSGANIDLLAAWPINGNPALARDQISSFATLRGRLGYAADRTLWYVTGGWGWADVKIAENFPFNDSNSKTQSGWVLGGGVEHALANNWSVKLEYLHFDLGHDNFTFPAFPATPFSAKTDLNIVRVGVNYRFGGDPWGKAPVAVAGIPTKSPAYSPHVNWTGLYAGVSAGYGHSGVDTFNNTLLTSTAQKLHGYFLGGQAGYNWQLNPSWVTGIEGDWSSANIDTVGTDPVGGVPGDFRYKMDSFATLRGRLGYSVDRTLWYVTGGWGWMQVKNTFDFPFMSTATVSPSGWTLGAGVEYAMTNNWSVKVEYLHIDGGHKTFIVQPFVGSPATENANLDLVRVGVNYKFGGDPWGKGPVSAKY